MAPSTTSMQQNRMRPATKRVTPAIPLPFLIQKRKQQEAALAAKKAEEEAAASTVEPREPEAPIEQIEAPTPPADCAKDENVPIEDAAPEESKDTEIEAASEPAVLEESSSTTPAPQEESITNEAEEETPLVREEAAGTQICCRLFVNKTDTNSEPSMDTPTSAASDNHSSTTSRSTYQMPPPFVPAQQQAQLQHNGGYHGYTAGQQGHSQNGGSVSNGYPASNRSSPAPLSAGYAPPMYPQQIPQYQHHPVQHAPHLSNGAPPSMSNGFAAAGAPRLPPGFNPMPANFANGGPEWFAPQPYIATNGFNNTEPSSAGTPAQMDGPAPSTPHSLHGSQASFDNHREGLYYTPRPPIPGPPGVLVYATNNAYGNGPSKFKFRRRASHEPFVRPTVTTEPDDYDGTTQLIRQKFGQPEYSEFTLTLSYTDGRVSPMRLAVHGIILDRSTTLRALMRNTMQSGSRDLILNTDDRFITNEGYFLALQRVYCESLLDHFILAEIERKSENQGKAFDPASFALSYAASGQLLGLPSVVDRGTNLACWLLNFNSIERLLEFATDGGIEQQWFKRHTPDTQNSRATYGVASNKIIDKAIMFLVANFPPRLLSTDFSAVELSRDTRLPSEPQTQDTPPLAWSTTHNPRLSTIKFGDHEDEKPVETEADANVLVISRLLLNIPFHLLTWVLERNLPPSVLGWSDLTVRHTFMSALIKEREKRRLRVLKSSVPNDERRANEKTWKVVGWEEKVEADVEMGPYLSINWVGFEKSA